MSQILIQQQLDKTYLIWCEGSTDEPKAAEWDLVAYSEASCMQAKIFSETRDFLAIKELPSLYIRELKKQGKIK